MLELFTQVAPADKKDACSIHISNKLGPMEVLKQSLLPIWFKHPYDVIITRACSLKPGLNEKVIDGANLLLCATL